MEIDLSLNRSLEELIASYWEFIAENGDITEYFFIPAAKKKIILRDGINKIAHIKI